MCECLGGKPGRVEKSRGPKRKLQVRLHLIFCEKSSKSIYAGTRKMVNYACAG